MKTLEEKIAYIKTLNNNIINDVCSDKPYSEKKYLHMHQKNIKCICDDMNNSCQYNNRNGMDFFSNNSNINNVSIYGSNTNTQFTSCTLF